MGGTYRTHGKDEIACEVLIGKPGHRWEDDIKMDFREIGYNGCGLDSTGSGQVLVAGSCEHRNKASGFVKEWGFLVEPTDSQLLKKDTVQ